jgi:ParB family chromosome partitioning protein
LSSVPEQPLEASPSKSAAPGEDRLPAAAGAPRRGLGRGLEVLIGGAGETELTQLPVEAIHPNPRQPRKKHDAEAAHGLADSVRAQGVIQPVVVRRRAAGGFELIAGERRWRAAREAGLPTLPALVRDADDGEALLLALVENVARENLSPVEEARACALLIDDFQLSLGEVAERVGRSKPAVSNRMRLLELSDDILGMVDRGELSEGHARAVLSVPHQEGRRSLAKEIIATGMSVRAAEQKARWSGARQKPRVKGAPVDPELAARVRSAAERLTGLPVRLTRGRLEVLFADEYELAELAEALERFAP